MRWIERTNARTRLRLQCAHGCSRRKVALTPGTRLGPYEITDQIGVGGMGEVYRARDVNLGRDVAIKVLPEAFAQDADRLVRFEREAKTLASLNHPNIAIIYGFEKGPAAFDSAQAKEAGPTYGLRVSARIDPGSRN